VTHKAGGTGLGLAIVRQTLLAHDGAMAAESTPGHGTTIRLFLPADAPVHAHSVGGTNGS
jgi:signal transduction histidine kinase